MIQNDDYEDWDEAQLIEEGNMGVSKMKKQMSTFIQDKQKSLTSQLMKVFEANGIDHSAFNN